MSLESQRVFQNSGSIEILGKRNSLFPSGPVTKTRFDTEARANSEITIPYHAVLLFIDPFHKWLPI